MGNTVPQQPTRSTIPTLEFLPGDLVHFISPPPQIQQHVRFNHTYVVTRVQQDLFPPVTPTSPLTPSSLPTTNFPLFPPKMSIQNSHQATLQRPVMSFQPPQMASSIASQQQQMPPPSQYHFMQAPQQQPHYQAYPYQQQQAMIQAQQRSPAPMTSSNHMTNSTNHQNNINNHNSLYPTIHAPPPMNHNYHTNQPSSSTSPLPSQQQQQQQVQHMPPSPSYSHYMATSPLSNHHLPPQQYYQQSIQQQLHLQQQHQQLQQQQQQAYMYQSYYQAYQQQQQPPPPYYSIYPATTASLPQQQQYYQSVPQQPQQQQYLSPPMSTSQIPPSSPLPPASPTMSTAAAAASKVEMSSNSHHPPHHQTMRGRSSPSPIVTTTTTCNHNHQVNQINYYNNNNNNNNNMNHTNVHNNHMTHHTHQRPMVPMSSSPPQSQQQHQSQQQQECYITVQSLIDNHTIQCHSSHIRLLPNNQSNKQRRIEYSLAQQYVQTCRSLRIKPLFVILDLYSRAIQQGEPVTVLSLSKRNISDQQAIAIVQLLKQGSLVRRLDLSHNSLSDKACEVIGENLGKWKQLRELDLSHNKLNVNAAVHIGNGLRYNRSLHLLNMCHTGIASQGCDHLLNGMDMNVNHTSLMKLDLRYNQVSEKQIVKLLKIARLCKNLCFVRVYPANPDALRKQTLVSSGDASVKKSQDAAQLYSAEDEAKRDGPSMKKNREEVGSPVVVASSSCSPLSPSTPPANNNVNASNPSSLSPPPPVLVDENPEDAWLSYEGWVIHSELNSCLANNVQYMKHHPSELKIDNESSDDMLDYLSYGVSVLKDDYIAPILLGSSPAKNQGTMTHSTNTAHPNASHSPPQQQQHASSASYDQWKKSQKQIASGYKHLNQQPSMNNSSSTAGEDEWVMVSDSPPNKNNNLNQSIPNHSGRNQGSIPVPKITPMSKRNMTTDPDLLSLYQSKLSLNDTNNSIQPSHNVDHEINSELRSSPDEIQIECKICLEEHPVSNIFILDNCDHKFCLQCLRQYVSVKINSGEVESIRCPDYDCKCNLSISDIKQLSRNVSDGTATDTSGSALLNDTKQKTDLFDKFDRIALQKALSQMGDLVYCPNPSCGNAMIINDRTVEEGYVNKKSHKRIQSTCEDLPSDCDHHHMSESLPSMSTSYRSPPTPSNQSLQKRIKCTHCQLLFCRLCKKEWHEGISCEDNEVRRKDEQEEQFKKWMEETGNVKNCPKCNITIQKHRGCNSMKCGNCQQQFCWFCGTTFDAADEKAHFRSCHRWSLFGINI